MKIGGEKAVQPTQQQPTHRAAPPRQQPTGARGARCWVGGGGVEGGLPAAVLFDRRVDRIQPIVPLLHISEITKTH